MLRALRHRFLRRTETPLPRGRQATPDDLRFCYRLLLGREPDEPGMQTWLESMRKTHVSTRDLVLGFMRELEYAHYMGLNDVQRFYLSDESIRLIDLPDLKIYVDHKDAWISQALFEQGYENHVLATLRECLHPGAVMLDIGANIGYLSLAAATLVGSTGKVIAVEPNPENCLLMRSSIAINGFRHVEVYPVAAAAQSGTFVLEVSGSNGRMLPLEQQRSVSGFRYLIFAQAIDELLPDLPRLDLVKLDIEGAEPLALAGMRRTIERHRPLIISEFGPEMLRGTANTEPAAYLAMLRNLGYSLSVITAAGSEPLPLDWPTIEARYFADQRSHIDLLARPA